MEIPVKCPKTIAEIHEALLELNKQSYKDKVCMSVQVMPMKYWTTVSVYVHTENKREKNQCCSVTFWPKEEGNSADNPKEWKKMLKYYERQRKYNAKHGFKE